jgi:hypothetical protein
MQSKKGPYLIFTPGKSHALDVSTISLIAKYSSNVPRVSVTGEPEAGVTPTKKKRNPACLHPLKDMPILSTARKGGAGGVIQRKGGGLPEGFQSKGGAPPGGVGATVGLPPKRVKVR